jgi:hypothetical protein
MLGSKMVTFGPKAGANCAALAFDPPVLALDMSATTPSARDRIFVDRKRDIEPSSVP